MLKENKASLLLSIFITFVVIVAVTIIVKKQYKAHGEPVPSPSVETQSEEVFCGGTTNMECPEGYKCVIDDDYPDVDGVCQEL